MKEFSFIGVLSTERRPSGANRVAGFGLNEVKPMTDQGSQTTILAANLVFQLVVAAGL